jgi:hypothetical protein
MAIAKVHLDFSDHLERFAGHAVTFLSLTVRPFLVVFLYVHPDIEHNRPLSCHALLSSYLFEILLQQTIAKRRGVSCKDLKHASDDGARGDKKY